MCHQKTNWSENLPIVLMGLRAAYKDDIGATPAEMMYGQNIRLPGEFLNPSLQKNVDQPEFITRLREQFNSLRPVPTSNHAKANIFVHPNLANCSHTFVRNDTVRRSLQPPYEGPYPIVSRAKKYFIVNIKGQHKNISVDRLKLAYSLVKNTDTKDYTTRSGRKVRFILPDLAQNRSQ
ncbi:uncharacterized protein LOC105433211 [Pogonomyrmex barbatus]|uniref:Uncharacterized protein LOC105433211 n=1 Tax=Pogonomyrmex barbatus TaxID=144034 RepID=A0A6I9WS01_9HYME|nr:uncharacterized protein LOC105433211 [Pogonomyrmex barbatus]